MANVPQEFNTFYLKDVSFVNLMTRRIFNVLIVANPYDAFMLEDDGRVDEKIFDEYTVLDVAEDPMDDPTVTNNTGNSPEPTTKGTEADTQQEHNG